MKVNSNLEAEFSYFLFLASFYELRKLANVEKTTFDCRPDTASNKSLDRADRDCAK